MVDRRVTDLARLYPGRWSCLLFPLGAASKKPLYTGFKDQALQRYHDANAAEVERNLYSVARHIECGANVVRIGSAIFGSEEGASPPA